MLLFGSLPAPKTLLAQRALLWEPDHIDLYASFVLVIALGTSSRMDPRRLSFRGPKSLRSNPEAALDHPFRPDGACCRRCYGHDHGLIYVRRLKTFQGCSSISSVSVSLLWFC